MKRRYKAKRSHKEANDNSVDAYENIARLQSAEESIVK